MQDAKPQGTKERLFLAAIQVFAAKGFQAATVRAICERAGANVAAVNYHFGDKERLYGQVLEHIFATPRKKRGTLCDLDPRDAPAKERLRAFIRNFLHETYDCVDDQEHCADLASIYLMEMAHPSKALDHIVEEYIRSDAELLAVIIRDLLGPDAPDHLAAYCARAAVAQALDYCNTGPILERLYPDREPFRTEMLDGLAELAFQFTMGGIDRLKTLGAPKE